MKKYLLLIPIVAFTFTGCDEDNLDIPQKGVISMDSFYKTDADAESALTVVYYDTHTNFVSIPEVTGYNYGPYFGLTNFQADDIYMAGSGPEDCTDERAFHDFRYANDNLVPLGGYTAFYRSIHKCNLVINNFTAERIGTLTPTMKRCVAEARVMRAFDHMMLGIYWGTPPIVETVLTGASRPANSESQEAVMTWVAKEIDLALPDLEERKSTTDKEGTVKVTKGFANAVKGKALLWKGDYNGAKTALKSVIDSKKYALVDDIKKILHADGNCSSESVFEFNVVYVPGVVEDLGNRSGRNDIMTFNWRWEWFKTPSKDDSQLKSEGWGWMNPTGDFARALIANDGMDSPRRKAWIKTYDEILYDHQYTSDGDSFTPGKTAAKEADAGRGLNHYIYGNEGYFIWKNVIHADQGDWLKLGWCGAWNRNFEIMRYAEVLLLYAEACAQTNDPDGLQYLNLIQDRAGSKHRSTACTLEEVQKEKQFELWLEGTRSADLIRWKKYDTFKKQDHYVPSFSDHMIDKTNPTSTHQGYIDETDAGYYLTLPVKPEFREDKHTLLPFPRTVVQLNPTLTQNPNWN